MRSRDVVVVLGVAFVLASCTLKAELPENPYINPYNVAVYERICIVQTGEEDYYSYEFKGLTRDGKLRVDETKEAVSKKIELAIDGNNEALLTIANGNMILLTLNPEAMTLRAKRERYR